MTGPLLPHERKRGLGDVDYAEEIRLNLRRNSSRLVSSIGLMSPYPALLTSTSSRPNAFVATATASTAACSLVTSSATVRTWSPYRSIRSASCAGLRAVATSLWPAASTASASARPRPRELPVINHTCDIGLTLAFPIRFLARRWHVINRQVTPVGSVIQRHSSSRKSTLGRLGTSNPGLARFGRWTRSSRTMRSSNGTSHTPFRPWVSIWQCVLRGPVHRSARPRERTRPSLRPSAAPRRR